MFKRKLILNKLSKVDDLPTFPETAMKVRERLQDSKAGVNDIAVFVENDPAIASRILKLANSSYYSFGERQFGNVREAMVRMGLGEVEKLVLAMGVMKVFKKSGLPKNYFKEFWTHSIMVGLTTKEIIASSRLPGKKKIDQKSIFTAGLFHAIGRLILFQYFPNYFKDVFELCRENDLDLYEIENNELGINHAEIGAILLDRWNLPEFICDSVMYQYEPDKCKPETKIYAQAVHLSNFSVSCNGNPLPEGNLPKRFSQGAWHDLEMAEDIVELIERVRNSEEQATIMASIGLQ